MAIINIGTASNTSGATLAISSVTVPAGATILLFIYELNTVSSTPGSVSDGANTYQNVQSSGVNNNFASYGVGMAIAAYNATLTSGTITYTKTHSGSKCAMTAVYVDNVTFIPIDVYPVNWGSSTSPSVTSTAPFESGEYVSACSFSYGTFSTFTQDSTNGSYTTPPNSVQTGTGSSDIQIYGGAYQSITQPLTFKYNPALGTSAPWLAILVALKPSVLPSPSSTAFFPFLG